MGSCRRASGILPRASPSPSLAGAGGEPRRVAGDPDPHGDGVLGGGRPAARDLEADEAPGAVDRQPSGYAARRGSGDGRDVDAAQGMDRPRAEDVEVAGRSILAGKRPDYEVAGNRPGERREEIAISQAIESRSRPRHPPSLIPSHAS